MHRMENFEFRSVIYVPLTSSLAILLRLLPFLKEMYFEYDDQ
jgi:hypothetical protein